jgi:hypothetical protein
VEYFFFLLSFQIFRFAKTYKNIWEKQAKFTAEKYLKE